MQRELHRLKTTTKNIATVPTDPANLIEYRVERAVKRVIRYFYPYVGKKSLTQSAEVALDKYLSWK